MSSTTETSPAVEQAKKHTTMAKDRLLKTYGFVPDEKLEWAPEPTGRSAQRIAVHCGRSNEAFLMLLSGQQIPTPNPEMMAQWLADEKAPRSREETVAMIEESTAKVISQLDAMTPEQIDSTVETPYFTAPMAFFMHLPGRHMDNHASQIDYLQTCWGDMDWHM